MHIGTLIRRTEGSADRLDPCSRCSNPSVSPVTPVGSPGAPLVSKSAGRLGCLAGCGKTEGPSQVSSDPSGTSKGLSGSSRRDRTPIHNKYEALAPESDDEDEGSQGDQEQHTEQPKPKEEDPSAPSKGPRVRPPRVKPKTKVTAMKTTDMTMHSQT